MDLTDEALYFSCYTIDVRRINDKEVLWKIWNYNKWCENNPNEDVRNMYYIFQSRNKRLKESGREVHGADGIMMNAVSDKYLSLKFPYYLVLHEFSYFLWKRKEMYYLNEGTYYTSYTEVWTEERKAKKSIWEKVKIFLKWT